MSLLSSAQVLPLAAEAVGTLQRRRGAVREPSVSDVVEYLDKLDAVIETKEGMLDKIKEQSASLRWELEQEAELAKKQESLQLIEEEWLI